jgi:hypothetical protein
VFKYRTNSPNILPCPGSNFLKGIMWAARVAKLGYK